MTRPARRGGWAGSVRFARSVGSVRFPRSVSGSLGAGNQYPLKLGAALLATIPVAVIFVIFQRYFVRDANEGAEKG